MIAGYQCFHVGHSQPGKARKQVVYTGGNLALQMAGRSGNSKRKPDASNFPERVDVPVGTVWKLNAGMCSGTSIELQHPPRS
jgi:hypothetical protein